MNSDTHQNVIGFVVDHQTQTIISGASGIVDRGDILNYIDAKKQAGVLGYVEVFDARDIIVDLSITDLPVIGDAMRNAMDGQRTARTAVVTNSGFVYGLVKKYGEIANADEPLFKVFASYAEASNWVSGEE